MIKYWLESTRPKTLAASAVPVIVGSSIAYFYDKFNLLIALIILVCAILIQITTNYFNEIYDFKYGTDNNERVGPRRNVSSGLIDAKSMMVVTLMLCVLTFFLGLSLVEYSDYKILIVGLLSLLFAFLYTGGPYPLAYNGLGDIFVFIFFGLIAVNGTFYVFTKHINLDSIICSIPIGLLSVNILNVNNIRDIETDYLSRKITFAYRIGRNNAVLMYRINNYICYLALILLIIIHNNFFFAIPFLILPLSLYLNKQIAILKGGAMNKLLALTSVSLLLYGVLISISFIMSK